MDLFKVTGENFELSVPLKKYDERTGEFEAWATLEELDKSNEIIDLDKSWPYFEAHSKKFSDATGGESFGNVREQHDPRKAAGKLVAAPEIRKHDNGSRGVYVKGLAVDPVTKDKLASRVLVGVSIGGSYIEKVAADEVKKGAMRYTANPSEYSLVDNPCVENAMITVVRADGSEELAKAVGFQPVQGFECRAGGFHLRKDEARRCNDAHGSAILSVDVEKVTENDLDKISAAERNALSDSDFALPGRRYPIDTKARARNALARGAQNATPEELATIRRKVKARYPDIDVGGESEKAANEETLKKCLGCVSQLAMIISNAEALVEWLEEYESGDDHDSAELEIADKIEEATSSLYEALHELVTDAQMDAQGEEAMEGKPMPPAAEVTDNSPAMQMSALAETLKKKPAIKTLLQKSLRVRFGNGSKEVQMDEKNAPKEEKAEKSAGDGELTKASTDQIAKAVSDGLAKALEPFTAKVDAIEKANADQKTLIDRLTAVVAKIVNAPAPPKAVKRVTKAEDGKDSGVEHDKPQKSAVEKTSRDLMDEAIAQPRPVAFGSGLVRESAAQ